MLTVDDETLSWYLRMNRAQLVVFYRDMEGTAEMITSRIPGLRETVDESLSQTQDQLLGLFDRAEAIGMGDPTTEEIDVAEIFVRSLDTVEEWKDGEEDWDALEEALLEDDPDLDRAVVSRAVRELRRYLALQSIVRGHATLNELEEEK